MKKINDNPLVWFVGVVILGWFVVENNNLEDFVILGFAVTIAKIVEMINKIEQK